MIKRKFEVPSEFVDKRLDVFLTTVLEISRSQAQKMVKHGLVEVNGKMPSVHRWLKEGDKVFIKEKIILPKVFVETPELNIVVETENYIVLMKPAGVIVHPAVGSAASSLIEALVRYCPSIVSVGQESRPGIVHRLDKDVCGLLVVAKTQRMYDELQRQFKERLIKKCYIALVDGVVTKPEGTLDFVMARSKSLPGRMAARPRGQEGRSAETRFTVLKNFAHHTLLELELITGRTHQIRAHLKAFKHPIVGDKLYDTRRKNAKKPVSGLNRLFLQATTLGFFDLKGQWQEYSAALDDELQSFLGTLS